jgi:hypothetical protein
MLTTETFWSQIGLYNDATFIVQIVMSIVAIVLLLYIFTKPGNRANILMKAFLSFAFAWNAIVFFLIYAEPSLFSYLGAILFIIISILFAFDIFTKKIEFRFPQSNYIKYLTIIFIFLVFLYPLIGYALGHVYPETCTPMMPCPLTVFAITLVVAAIPKVDKKVFVTLLPWALLGLPKCLGVSDCYEDCILFISGIYGVVLLVKKWKKIV